MDLKLLFIFSILCVATFQECDSAFTIPKDKVDSLEKWTEVGVKAAASLGKNEDLNIAISIINALGKAIPQAGPLASLISGILGLFIHKGPSELSVVLDKLEGMNRKLDHLDDRLSEVMVKIESVHIIAGYKAKVDDVHKLKHAYERFTATPNNLTRDDFRRECGTNKMLEFAHWIEAELSSESQLPLRQVMIQDFDLRTFNYWSAQIASMLSNAMFLHTTCVGVSGYNETTISETLNGRGASHNGDIHAFQLILTNVRKSIYHGSKLIKRKFFAHAKGEVDAFMRDHVDTWDHRGFVDHLHEKLAQKYYWRAWSVTSWNDGTKGFDHHAIVSGDKNSWFWHSQHKRNLLVGSVLNDFSTLKLDEHLNQCDVAHQKVHVTGELAKSLNEYFVPCIRHSTPLEALAVVTFGNGLRSIGPAQFFKNVKYNNHELSVVAIPYDGSAALGSGEVCSASGAMCDNSDQQHCCGYHLCCSDLV